MGFWVRRERPVAAPPGVISSVLIPLANAAFIALALYSVLQDSGLHSLVAWLMVALAAVFLGLIRLQWTPLAAAMHLASAVVFLTIAIPLKASGQSLTAAWLVEGLILYWASIRFASESKAPSVALSILAAGGYILGLVSVIWHWTWNAPGYSLTTSFFNANLGSALVAVAALAGAAWLALGTNRRRPRSDHSEGVAVLIAALCAVDGVALLLAWRGDHPVFVLDKNAFANPGFATALVGIILLAATSWAAWRIFKQDQRVYAPFRIIAAADLILFNLVTILVVEQEIGTLFAHAEAGLQRSLAISAFLMIYGALLLAAGFWRRNAFVRWQALLLILFTIAKVFLYDISGLSAGYRVASFLALGALLLTVSFAYQKDWLDLKVPAQTSGESV